MGDLRERVGNFFHEHRRSVLNASAFTILAAYVLGNGALAIAAPSCDDPVGNDATPTAVVTEGGAEQGNQASLNFQKDEAYDSCCKTLYEATAELCNTGEVPTAVELSYSIIKEGEDNDLSFNVDPLYIEELVGGACVDIHATLETGIQQLMEGEEVKARVEACIPDSEHQCATLTFTAEGHCNATAIGLKSLDAYFLQTDEPPSYEPEPGTILLLGASLMGLAGYAGLRLMKK